jgi:hypothetical protein
MRRLDIWRGKVTPELRELARQYGELFNGIYPDGYDCLDCNFLTYEEFVKSIKTCLEKHLEMPDVVPAAAVQYWPSL